MQRHSIDFEAIASALDSEISLKDFLMMYLVVQYDAEEHLRIFFDTDSYLKFLIDDKRLDDTVLTIRQLVEYLEYHKL